MAFLFVTVLKIEVEVRQRGSFFATLLNVLDDGRAKHQSKQRQ